MSQILDIRTKYLELSPKYGIRDQLVESALTGTPASGLVCEHVLRTFEELVVVFVHTSRWWERVAGEVFRACYGAWEEAEKSSTGRLQDDNVPVDRGRERRISAEGGECGGGCRKWGKRCEERVDGRSKPGSASSGLPERERALGVEVREQVKNGFRFSRYSTTKMVNKQVRLHV